MKNSKIINLTPIILIGAPRSGTNIFRDTIATLPSVTTWPCDEINYIWRHGNINYPSDEFPVELATPVVKEYIHKKFEEVANSSNCEFVLEKTCANSLRVDFVNAVFPDSKIILIVRDGIDVVASIKKRWSSKFDILYTSKKVRFVPLADIPYYALKFMYNRVYKLTSSENRLSYWGPVLNNMAEIHNNHTLLEICALQWKNCVDSAEDSLNRIDKNRWLKIKYEDFVINPDHVMNVIFDFLNIEDKDPRQIGQMNIKSNSVGRGRVELENSEIDIIKPIIINTMVRNGYRI